MVVTCVLLDVSKYWHQNAILISFKIENVWFSLANHILYRMSHTHLSGEYSMVRGYGKMQRQS